MPSARSASLRPASARPLCRAGALLAAALALGGCAPSPPSLDDTLASTRASLAALATEAPVLAAAAPVPTGPAPVPLRAVAARPRAPAVELVPAGLPASPALAVGPGLVPGAETAGAPTQAAQLLGAPPAALTRLLGPPRLRRAEGEAEIWLYQGAACHLDLVLYPAAGGGLRVAWAAARAGGVERRGEAACLRDLASASPGREAGTGT